MECIHREQAKDLEKELKNSQTNFKLLGSVTHLVFKGWKRNNTTADFSQEHFLGNTPEQALALNNGSQPFEKPVKMSMTQAKLFHKADFLHMLMKNAHEGSPNTEEAVEVDSVTGHILENFQQKLAVTSDNTHNPERQC